MLAASSPWSIPGAFLERLWSIPTPSPCLVLPWLEIFALRRMAAPEPKWGEVVRLWLLHPQPQATPVQEEPARKELSDPTALGSMPSKASVTSLRGGRMAGWACDVNTTPPCNRTGKSICQDAAHQLTFAGIITHLRTAGCRELIRGLPGSRDNQGGKSNVGTQHSPAVPMVPRAVPEAPGGLPAPRRMWPIGGTLGERPNIRVIPSPGTMHPHHGKVRSWESSEAWSGKK